MYVRAVIEEGVRESANRGAAAGGHARQQGRRDRDGGRRRRKVELRKLQPPRTLGAEWLIDAGLQAGIG